MSHNSTLVPFTEEKLGKHFHLGCPFLFLLSVYRWFYCGHCLLSVPTSSSVTADTCGSLHRFIGTVHRGGQNWAGGSVWGRTENKGNLYKLLRFHGFLAWQVRPRLGPCRNRSGRWDMLVNLRALMLLSIANTQSGHGCGFASPRPPFKHR